MRKVAILIFDNVEVLDFAGPYEVFAVSGQVIEPSPFTVYTVAEEDRPILARGGLSINPDYTIHTCPQPDILLVPGGQGTRAMVHHQTILDWIAAQAEQVEYLLSVCTGALLLGKVGLLDGMDSTTHHGAFDLLRYHAPHTHVVEDQRYVDNGKIVTSAGVSAGIDMALHMVHRLCGEDVYKTVDVMEYSWQA